MDLEGEGLGGPIAFGAPGAEAYVLVGTVPPPIVLPLEFPVVTTLQFPP